MKPCVKYFPLLCNKSFDSRENIVKGPLTGQDRSGKKVAWRRSVGWLDEGLPQSHQFKRCEALPLLGTVPGAVGERDRRGPHSRSSSHSSAALHAVETFSRSLLGFLLPLKQLFLLGLFAGSFQVPLPFPLTSVRSPQHSGFGHVLFSGWPHCCSDRIEARDPAFRPTLTTPTLLPLAQLSPLNYRLTYPVSTQPLRTDV